MDSRGRKIAPERRIRGEKRRICFGRQAGLPEKKRLPGAEEGDGIARAERNHGENRRKLRGKAFLKAQKLDKDRKKVYDRVSYCGFNRSRFQEVNNQWKNSTF